MRLVSGYLRSVGPEAMEGGYSADIDKSPAQPLVGKKRTPVVTLSLYTYAGVPAKIRAFTQMGFAHLRMRSRHAPKPLFYKLVGSGSGVGFDPKPNWARYGVLATWAHEADAREALISHPVLTGWQSRAVKTETFLLRPTRSSGLWSGVDPFPMGPGCHNVKKRKENDGPVAVITRARLKLGILVPFWRSVPSISQQIDDAEGLLFKVGIGEIPWLHQITFSLWRDSSAIRDFAYKDGAHARAIDAARKNGWFGEELFARFELVSRSVHTSCTDPSS